MSGLIIARYFRRDSYLKHHPPVTPIRHRRIKTAPGDDPHGNHIKSRGRERMRPIFCLIMALMAAISATSASAQSPQKWVTSWTGSVQGPYPIGNPSAQPDLRFAFPSPETGARDQNSIPVTQR
jgi:hypothetical protein